ncbi:MAG: hypothetical protein V8T90_16500 [Victivallales bacterium]
MKKVPFHFHLLLACALALALNGLLHPCLHHHTNPGSETTVLCAADDSLQSQPDDPFCPLCSGILTGAEWNAPSLPLPATSATDIPAEPGNAPPPSFYPLPPSRAPPARNHAPIC